jgi:hypothetical protein
MPLKRGMMFLMASGSRHLLAREGGSLGCAAARLSQATLACPSAKGKARAKQGCHDKNFHAITLNPQQSVDVRIQGSAQSSVLKFFPLLPEPWVAATQKSTCLSTTPCQHRAAAPGSARSKARSPNAPDGCANKKIVKMLDISEMTPTIFASKQASKQAAGSPISF